jgi:hypothetical protein
MKSRFTNIMLYFASLFGMDVAGVAVAAVVDDVVVVCSVDIVVVVVVAVVVVFAVAAAAEVFALFKQKLVNPTFKKLFAAGVCSSRQAPKGDVIHEKTHE